MCAPTLDGTSGIFLKQNPTNAAPCASSRSNISDYLPMPILISPQIYWLCYGNIASQRRMRPGGMKMGHKMILTYSCMSHQQLNNSSIPHYSP